MIEKILEQVELIFKDVPNTYRARELKEEMQANLIDRYNDLLKDGKSADQAYDKVINSIGDVDELLKNLDEPEPLNYASIERKRQEHAKRVTITVSGYILALILAITANNFVDSDIAGLIFLIIAGMSTCFLIYTTMTKPTYMKKDDTMVEEFKQWTNKKEKKKSIRSSVYTILWLMIVIIYFVISFATHAWYITWVIFLIGAALNSVLRIIFTLNEKE